ncbi:MAG: ion transporter [Silvanigrellales bacterium]|nr:ion transporter [Silvanigrellales bacterium]
MYKVARLVHSSWYQNLIVMFILLAAIVVGLETYPAVMARHGATLRVLDKVIVGIFVVEIALKLAALGRNWPQFFKDGWNVFDFAVVTVCLLPLNTEFAAVFRLVRILRVLRLISALPRLQLIVGALLKSIPSIGYVGVLLTLLFYVFAVLGVSLFGQNDPFRFGDLQSALLTLFQIATMENWVELMHTQMYGCDVFGYGDEIKHLCIAPRAAPIEAVLFFLAFIVLGTMIILNLFIGVIMKGMEEMQEEVDQRRIESGEAKQVSIEQELGRLADELQALRSRMRRSI